MLMHRLAYLTHGLVEGEGDASVREPSIAPAADIYTRVDRATAVQHHIVLYLHFEYPFQAIHLHRVR